MDNEDRKKVAEEMADYAFEDLLASPRRTLVNLQLRLVKILEDNPNLVGRGWVEKDLFELGWTLDQLPPKPKTGEEIEKKEIEEIQRLTKELLGNIPRGFGTLKLPIYAANGGFKKGFTKYEPMSWETRSDLWLNHGAYVGRPCLIVQTYAGANFPICPNGSHSLELPKGLTRYELIYSLKSAFGPLADALQQESYERLKACRELQYKYGKELDRAEGLRED